MIKLNLRGCFLDVHFGKSELTNYLEILKARRFPELKSGEAVMMISKTGNQIVFILHYEKRGKRQHFIDSRRLRMTHGTWDPHMIQNYANSVGIELSNFKRLEAAFDK